MIAVSDVTTLGVYAQELRDVCVTALATTQDGAPPIAVVTPSEPIWDCCPALFVRVTALREAPTSPLSPPEQQAKRTSFGNVILATYVVTAIRCAPNPKEGLVMLPTDTEIEAVALQVLEDEWALWNGIRHAIQQNLLFDACLGVHFDGAGPVQEQGGCVGTQITVRADIPGIPI